MQAKSSLPIVLSILIIVASMPILHFRVVSAHDYGIVRIKADGTVDPPTAPIERNGDVYSLTDNIIANVSSDNYGIDIERNNTVLDGVGYSVKGANSRGSQWGIFFGGTNITVKNTRVESFGFGVEIYVFRNITIVDCNLTGNRIGIYIYQAWNNNIMGNSITNNTEGVYLGSCSGNNITGNNIVGNRVGIYLFDALENGIRGNSIMKNELDGIYVEQSRRNIVVGNDIRDNGQYGIDFWHIFEASNMIYNNNFINNSQGHVFTSGLCIWNSSYPTGGNYWDDYLQRYPNASEIDSSGIGDAAYVIDLENTDWQPLMKPYVIPEFSSFLLLPIFMVTTLFAVIVYRGKRKRHFVQ